MLKKWHDESEDRILGDSTGSGWRVRCQHGRSAGNLRKAVQSERARALHGRTARAVAERNALAHSPRHSQTRKRVDYEYERDAGRPPSSCSPNRWRAGVKSPFANGKQRSIGPSKWLDCWRVATRTCAKVILVCDNLNTHTKGAFYEAFEPERARALVRRIEFCYTPKHGSWLNVAECELSCLTSQCLSDRRIGELTPTFNSRSRRGPTQRMPSNAALTGSSASKTPG